MAKKNIFDNLKKSSEQNEFFYAVRRGKVDKVIELLKNGQDVNAYNVSRRTALHVAISKRDEEMVSVLLRYGADPYKSADDLNKTTPLDMVIARRVATMLKLLHKYKVDFNRVDDKGETALYKAVEENKPEMVECLLRWGADPLYTGSGKMTPVMLAFKRDNKEILELLMNNPAVVNNINSPTKLGMENETVLQQVLDYGATDTVPLLLRQGTVINTYNVNGQTPLHEVVEKGDLENAAILVEHGADLNSMPRYSDGYLPLHVACDVWMWQENKTADMLRMLLFAGADPNIADTKQQTTPLTILLMNDNLSNMSECIELLLDYGAATNVYDIHGKTPLLYALDSSSGDKFKISELLLNAGANPNLPDKNNGMTPTHVAAKNGDLDIVKLFVKHGANLQLKDKSGNTVLDIAKQKGLDVELSSMLKQESSVSVRKKGNNGRPNI